MTDRVRRGLGVALIGAVAWLAGTTTEVEVMAGLAPVGMIVTAFALVATGVSLIRGS